MAMTYATIGRRTKKAPMADLLSGFFGCCGLCLRRRRRGRRRLPGRHLHAAPHPLDAFDHDAVAGGEALLDDPHAAVAWPQRDDLDRRRVVGADDRDLVAALQLADRALRHEDRPLLDVDRDAHLSVLAGPQQV